MRATLLLLALGFAAVLVTACGDGGAGDVRAPGARGAVPALAAVTLDGDSVALADLRGHPVLLNVWATWCAPCRREIPELQALHEEYAPEGLRVVGVTVDARGAGEDVRRFIDAFGMTYAVWWDPDQRIVAELGAPGVPVTVLLDRQGRVAWSHLGALERGDPELSAAVQRLLDRS